VDLHLSLDGGFSWTAVATEVGGGIQNSFPYIVPATPTNYARVAVAPAGVSPIHSSADQSDSLFTIILPTGIDVLASTETNLLLSSPWPNPRIGPGGSTFHITLPSSETLQLALYDVRGRLVASRAPETFAVGGTHAVQWDPGSVSSGTYYVRLSTASGHSAGTTWVLVR
jgi:hypothetical protein